MHYREYNPSERLRPFIRCYWTLASDSPEPPPLQRVFPDGSIEIVFHFGEPYDRVDEHGRPERQAHSLLAGQIWAPLTLQPGARSDVLGIRFHPMGALPFLRFPLHEVSGQIVSLEEVWGSRARAWRDSLGDARDRIAILERYLLDCRPEPVPALQALSPRQHRRRFESCVGIPPKLYERIRRFQRALAEIGGLPIAQVAAACGYYDQSHLVRDFRQFTGLTPSNWLADHSNVPFLQDALDAEAVE